MIKMLELDFVTFMERFNREKNGNRKVIPTLYYEDTPKKFIFYYKTYEQWECFSNVLKSDITNFGEGYEVDEETAISDFKMRYCTGGSVQLKERPQEIANLPEDKPIEDIKKQVEPIGEDMVEEADSYDKYLTMMISAWEKRLLAAIDKELKTDKNYVQKGLSTLFAQIFNSINTLPFFKGLIKVLKIPLKTGLEEAEDELNLDIGVTAGFNQRAEFFAFQQLDGYTLPNGKKWHGIKGVSRETQTKIYKEIQDGVVNKESQTQIKDRVKGVFKQAKDTSAERIARTETTRIVNAGKNQGYLDAKVGGFKLWRTHHDSKTSDICKRLNKQKVPVNETFKDPKTMIEYDHPPAHPNCRSTIQFLPK